MAPHCSTLAWKIPWAEETGSCSPWGRVESDPTERLHFHFSLSCLGEGNGNPLQCSCLENPRDGGAWWAAVYGVAQSRRLLKRLSSSSSSSSISLRDGVIIRRRKVFVVFTLSLGLCLWIKTFQSPRKVNKTVKIFLLSFFVLCFICSFHFYAFPS